MRCDLICKEEEYWTRHHSPLMAKRALLVWMSQLTSPDNCALRALSQGAAVIVLIGPGPPLLVLRNHFRIQMVKNRGEIGFLKKHVWVSFIWLHTVD